MKKLSFVTRGKVVSFICLVPWLIGFFVFTLSPLWEVLTYSFSKTVFLTNGVVEKTFVGLDNYRDAFIKEGYFRIAMLEYLRQIFFMGPIILIFSLLVSLALNSFFRGRSFYRAVFFLPIILMQGPLLNTLEGLGTMTVKGLEDFFVFQFIGSGIPEVFSGPLMYAMRNFAYIVWLSGVQQLLLLAGLQKVDRNMYEAAAVDGASPWQRFWKITLPVIKPFILLAAIYTVVDLSMSSLNPITGLIKQFMQSKANGFGYSAAISFMYLLLILLCVGVYAAVITVRRRPGKEVGA